MHCKLLLATLALAAPLAAQEPGKPDSMRYPMMGPGMSEMMEGPMMRDMGSAMMKMMLNTPQHLLARKDALGLTGDQINRLSALRDGAKTARDAAMAEAQTHMKEMEQTANAAQPDTAALKTHFQAAHSAMGKAHWAMIASAAQARAVLTDAQRAKVQVWADSMQAWMQRHQRMMNPKRPH
jgi:Spy/CpxP family protein refolding chaperone